MLRAIRFSNQLGFEIEAKSFQSIENAERIKIISESVSLTSWIKLSTDKPSEGFLLLYKPGF
jgi:tRNA nucleotidyltransferase (CCA-adding enzyme)